MESDVKHACEEIATNVNLYRTARNLDDKYHAARQVRLARGSIIRQYGFRGIRMLGEKLSAIGLFGSYVDICQQNL